MVGLDEISRRLQSSFERGLTRLLGRGVRRHLRRVASRISHDAYPFYPHPYFPMLERQHIAGAKLFANREDLIRATMTAKGAVITEIGVGLGDFSRFLLNELNPSKFVAVDSFRLHETPQFSLRSTQSIFGKLTHLDFYKQQVSECADIVVIEEGLSWEVLERYPDRYFDLIYIDAAHDYESVRRDAEASVRKVRLDGVVVFNDYIMFDHLHGVPYGVVQTVNDLVVNQGWRVIGFALQLNLFCDIAIQRSS